MSDSAQDYSVSLYLTPLPRPLSFSSHAWFVIGQNGVFDRYEIWGTKEYIQYPEQTYIYKNIWPLELGFRSSFLQDPIHPKTTLPVQKLATIHGGENSIAHRMCKVIEASEKNYPFADIYKLIPGPNSNTYVQWVLNQFPESGFVLPKNAFGKGYAV